MEGLEDVRRATILGFRGCWSSGIAFMDVQHDDGTTASIPCDSGPLGRALINMFDCAGEGHTIDNSKLEGQRIVYVLEDLGLLGGVAREDHYDEALEAQNGV